MRVMRRAVRPQQNIQRPVKRRLEIALTVPETVRAFATSPGRGAGGQRKRKVKDVFRKGELLGTLDLDFEVFD